MHRRTTRARLLWIVLLAIALALLALTRSLPRTPVGALPIAMALPAGGRLLTSSVALAGLATLMATALAFPVGVTLGRGTGVVFAGLVLLPLVTPPEVAACLWRYALTDVAALFTGNAAVAGTHAFGFFAAAWTLAATAWPLIALAVALAMRAAGNRLEMELANLAPPGTVFRRATLPGLAPALVAGAGVVFLLALSDYAVPLAWDVPSQNRAVFARLAAFFEPREVLTLALPLVIVALAVCVAGLVWVWRRPYALDLTRATTRPGKGGVCAWLAALVLTVTVGAPVWAMFRGLDLSAVAFRDLRVGASPFLWGAILAALGASGATVAGVGLALLVRRAPKWVAAVVEGAALLALFVPAAVLCLVFSGLLRSGEWLLALYNSLGVFALAYGVRFLYIPFKIVRLASAFEGQAHDRVGRLLGLPILTRLRLRLGGVLPALSLAWLIVFAFVLGELEIATFLAQPGRQPLSVFLDNLLHYGRSTTVAVWFLLVLGAEAALAWIILFVGLSQWRKLRVNA